MKMNKFRLILDPQITGSMHMAKDSAVLYSLSQKEHHPTLRIGRWAEPTVSIGHLEDVNETVNINYCKKNNIPVIRRESGGGTVLHHMELSFSLTIPMSSVLIPQSVDESFRKIISPPIKTLKMFIEGVEYRPVNDIVVNKRKISGSAQVRKQGVLQQHGTVILDIDDEILSSAINYNESKLLNRGFTSQRQAVTSLKDEMGKEIDEKLIEEFTASLLKNFAKEFKVDFIESDITESEKTLMEEFVKKFSSDEWNLKK